MREHSPVERCKSCGAVTIMMVYETGLTDGGDPFQAIYRDAIPHTRKECKGMQALAREEWPTLW